MLIHGRLILTKNGFMLDEVRSLLQKALRRKEKELICMATKELLGFGKDQLPWKSLLTFLFEDQCLSDWKLLRKFYNEFSDKNKYRCVEILYHAHPCRIAACLPVAALDDKYDPKHWDADLEVDDSLVNLVGKASSKLNFDLLLAHIRKAWTERKDDELLTYFKLATIVCDHEDRDVTKKGEAFCIEKLQNRQKPKVGLVVISALHKVTQDKDMKLYLLYAFKLAAIADAPVRLILTCVYTQLVWGKVAKQVNVETIKFQMKITSASKLDRMPDWAVDKHTFRGKIGKGTKHLVKQKPSWMTEEQYDIFHGDRPKVGVQHFFDEGCVCENVAVDENPFWERTKEIYYSKTHRLQKTVRMTAIYYKELVKKYPALLYKSPKKQKAAASVSDSDSDDFVPVKQTRSGVKRKAITDPDRHAKRVKFDSESDEQDKKNSATNGETRSKSGKGKSITANKGKLSKNANSDGTKSSKATISSATETSSTETAASSTSETVTSNTELSDKIKSFPLLQLPTGSGKVYTRLDMDTDSVWKGPYRADKLSMVTFFHRALKEALGDPHTLQLTPRHQYAVFPLVKKAGSDVTIITKEFYDAISRTKVSKGDFVPRESLGIVQLHNLQPNQIASLPLTIWMHFVYRFLLNIGDSGMYNAITDPDMAFVYGIDMEENRKNVKGSDALNLMFVKLPRKIICDKIKACLRQNKTQMTSLLENVTDDKVKKIFVLAEQNKYDFQEDLFSKRLVMFKTAVNNL